MDAEGGRDELENEAQGEARVPRGKLGLALLRKSRENIRARRWQRENQLRRKPELEPCSDSPWHGQHVRVVAECLHEGKHGPVSDVQVYTRAHEITAPKYCLQVRDETSKNSQQILVEASQVVLEDPEWSKMAKEGRVWPFKIDWRKCPPERREYLAKDLAIGNCEAIKTGQTLEIGTITALLGELYERFDVDEDTLLIEPALSRIWALEGIEGALNPGAQERAFVEKVKKARHLYFVVHSENPAHYTELEVHKHEGLIEMDEIIFRDSLEKPPETAARMVEQLLKNLDFVEASWQCPPRVNELFQRDGWSCGLWAIRWIERSLRDRHGEGRMPPPSLKAVTDRGNEFIEKIKKAKDEEFVRVAAKAKAKAKAEAKAEAKASAKMRAQRRAMERPKQIEPVFETLEQALEAAQKCTKCLPTKSCTKGCRACMGEWFEDIRQKRAKF